MEQTQTKQLKHGRPIDGKGTYRLSKRWNESFSSTYIFKFFFFKTFANKYFKNLNQSFFGISISIKVNF